MTSVVPLEQEESKLNQEQQLDIDEYDEFKRPPDLLICRKHQSATQFGKADQNIDLNKDNLCPCCGQPIIVSRLPLCSSILEFSFNGPGVSLYFDFIVFSSIMIAVYILVCGIYNLIVSSLGDQCANYNTYGILLCKVNFYSKFAKTNQDNSSLDKAGSALNFVTSILIIILLFFYRKRINILSNKIDENSIMASDYSVIVENIPRDATENEIREFFSTVNRKPLIVKKVSVGYILREYLALEKQKQEQENTLTKILDFERKKKPIPPKLPNKPDLKQTINELSLKLEQYEENIEKNFSFSGSAIISFNTEDEANFVCRFFRATRIELLISQILQFIGRNDLRRFRGNIIIVSKAPEPGDIMWKNLGVTLLEQYKRIAITNFASIFLLGICFGILFGLSYAQFAISDQQTKATSSTEAFAITILGVISSVLISIINMILAKIIRKFAEMESPSTRTEFDISASKKLGLAQFLNTAIITLIVNLVIIENGETSYQAVMKEGGLNQDVMLIYITNGIMPWLMSIFDLSFFYKIYQRYSIRSQGENCVLTQKDANEIYAGPQIDLAQKYAQLGKTLMFTFFYAYLLPLGPVLSIGSLFFVYWVDKLLLLRRDSKPTPTGSDLSEEMVNFFGECTLMIFSAGCLAWEKILYDEIFALTWVQFGITVANFILPFDVCFEYFFKKQDLSTKELYDSKCQQFADDYDRRNPITQDKAIEQFLKTTTLTKTIDGKGNVQINNQQYRKRKNKKRIVQE